MPYRDPARPLIPWWFSASDAEGVEEFNELIHPRQQERLHRDGGFCIVATHFGKDFVRDGVVNPVTRARLEELSPAGVVSDDGRVVGLVASTARGGERQ